MQQQTEPVQTPLRRLGVRSRSVRTSLLLFQSLIWLGGFILLGNNLVVAQTESAIDAVIVPKSTSNPLTDANTTAATNRARLTRKLQAPGIRISFPANSSIAVPTTKKLKNIQPKSIRLSSNSASDYNGAYIDPTNYSIGATRSYKAPRVIPRNRRRTATRGTQAIKTTRLARSLMPNIVPRSRRAANNPPVVRIGALRITKNGLRTTQRTPTVPNTIAWRNNTLPSLQGKVYYKQSSNSNIKLLFPLTIPAPITSLFGWRIHPITGDRRFHAGTDLGAPWGTPVLAALAGRVAIADVLGGYGLTVVLEHEKPSNFLGTATPDSPPQQTLYGHLSEIFVQPGDWVEQGTAIARVGSTGNSTGPHLHFETRQLTPQGWVAVDPGLQLESALTQLVDALRTTAHSNQKPVNNS